MLYRSLFLFLIFATLLTACKPSASKRSILVIGDSNAVGEGWVYAFQELRGGGPLVNTAIGGNTVGFDGQNTIRRNTLEQLTSYLRRGYAEMGAIDEIIIGLGTNDCKAEYADRRAEGRANLDKLLERTKAFFSERGQPLPRIVLLTPPPAGADAVVSDEFRGVKACLADLSDHIRAVAAREDLCLVDLQRQPGDAILNDSRDGIHFGAEGYRAIAGAVLGGCY